MVINLGTNWLYYTYSIYSNHVIMHQLLTNPVLVHHVHSECYTVTYHMVLIQRMIYPKLLRQEIHSTFELTNLLGHGVYYLKITTHPTYFHSPSQPYLTWIHTITTSLGYNDHQYHYQWLSEDQVYTTWTVTLHWWFQWQPGFSFTSSW